MQLNLKTWHCLGLLFVAVFGAYLNGLGNGLVGFDDAVILHPSGSFGVADLERRLEDFRKDPLRQLPALLVSRPLSDLTHALDVALFADDYWGHHFSNVAYHFLACCFAFLAATELLGSRTGGLAAALVFALHPAQTESVAYIAGRRDVLCGMLSLASFYLWLRRRRAATAAAVAAWVLAMTAKISAVTVPLLWLAATGIDPAAPAADLLKLKRPLVRDLAISLGCVAVCVAAVATPLLMQAAWAQRLHLPRELFWYGGSATSQWATEPRLVMHALKLLLWPVRLSADYSLNVFEPSRSLLEARSLLALAGCGGLVWLAWALRERRPLESFALAWIMLAYAPMLHVLPTLHNQEPFAEHWLYLPLFGWGLILGNTLGNAGRLRKPVAAGLGALLCLYAGRTVLRNRDWKDALTLWSRTVKTEPRCGRAQDILGMAYLERGDPAAAEPFLLRAVELRPDDPKNYINLALLYRNTGRFRQAELALLRARGLPLAKLLQDDVAYALDLVYLASGQLRKIRRPPLSDAAGSSAPATMSSRSLDLAGTVAAARGDPQLAERLYARALDRSPDSPAALYHLGLLYFAGGRFELAAIRFKKLLERNPALLNARIDLGLSYAEIGDAPRARQALEQALKEAPRSADAWLALSRFHLMRRELPRALAEARQAARLESSPRTNRQLYRVYREM